MTKSRSAGTAAAIELSPHIRETFTKAEELIRKTYGDSPPADTLVRMWLLSATSLGVMEEFEEAVMETSERPPAPVSGGGSDGSALNL